MKRYLPYLFSALFLNACLTDGTSGYSLYLTRKNLPEPTVERFAHCHGYGCENTQTLSFTPLEWKAISTRFKPTPQTAAEERKRIEEAIGHFEKIVGERAGTDKDLRGTFRKTGLRQLDCVDESTNTTIYLRLLEKEGLLRFHTLQGPSSRLLIKGRPGWPHQTAVIKEIESGEAFAVDSWFRDNGYNALTVPMSEWNKGWLPPDSLRPEILEEE